MIFDDRWRVEALNDDGLWQAVQLADIRRWQVFRVFDENNLPVRHRDTSDGCPVFVALESAMRVCTHDGIPFCVEVVPIRGAADEDIVKNDGTVLVDREITKTWIRDRQMQIAQAVNTGMGLDALSSDIRRNQSMLEAGETTIHRMLTQETNVACYPLAVWMQEVVRKGLVQQREWRAQVSQEVDIWCTCGGRGPDDEECCQACQLYYMVTGDRRGSVRR
jgi:hypothetical protein